MNASIKPVRSAFQPGESIEGTVSWTVPRAPHKAELRLFWQTRGKGTRDVGLVETLDFEGPQSSDSRPFRFVAPDGPLSFSGRLISLLWGLELVVEPGESLAVDLTIGPGRREISLDRGEWLEVPESPRPGGLRFQS